MASSMPISGVPPGTADDLLDELVVLLGRGGMGEVWAGRDRVLRREVAVKLLGTTNGPPGLIGPGCASISHCADTYLPHLEGTIYLSTGWFSCRAGLRR